MPHWSRHVWFERLESRSLLSASLTVLSLKDVSKLVGPESEAAVAISRATNNLPAGRQIFIGSNIEGLADNSPPTPVATARDSREEQEHNRDGSAGMMFSSSSDGGSTFTARLGATDTSGDGLEPACCDPSFAHDEFGNLFITYLANDSRRPGVLLYVSTNNGTDWTLVKRFGGDVDQPTVVAGNGLVYLTFNLNGRAVSSGARVSGLGVVGKMSGLRVVPGPGGNFGDIAIGPGGQVGVTYLEGNDGEDHSSVWFAADRDGPGPLGFDRAVKVADVNIGTFTYFPAQSERAVDPEISLAWDRSGGPAHGRIYLTYTDRTSGDETGDGTKIVTRYSDDAGSTWSAEIRLDDGPDGATRILPRTAIDQTTGALVAGWHDARYDTGTGDDSTDDVANNDVAYVATVATPSPSGLTVAPNLRVTPGVTNAKLGGSGVELGDYTGLDADGGLAAAVFADNSNTTGDNPDGTHKDQDIYLALLQVSDATQSGAPGSFRPDSLSTLLSNTSRPVRSGRAVNLSLTLKDPGGFDVADLGSLTATDSGGRSLNLTLTRKAVSRDLRTASLSFRLTRSDNQKFSFADNGTYTITLSGLTDRLGQASQARTLGTVTVAVPGAPVAITGSTLAVFSRVPVVPGLSFSQETGRATDDLTGLEGVLA